MSRRQRRKQREKEKRLERLPEKLQRKRERRERYRARRMPNWIRYGLVVAVLVVIIVGAWFIIPKENPIIPEPEPGDVHILQQDMFYCFINETGHVNIDYLQGRYGLGTYEGDQPLNVTIQRIFEEAQRNFTFPNVGVFYDYYGNAYNIIPSVEANSFEYRIEQVYPAFLTNDKEISIDGGAQMRGYWSLFFDYLINSSLDSHLAQDSLEQMFSFDFIVAAENDTLAYNIPNIVRCNITFNTLMRDTNIYNFGEARIVIPKQIFNGTTLLANITLHDTYRRGSSTTLGPNINNATHIVYNETFGVAMSENQTWGFEFDLNVTAFTNSSFCLLDLTLPYNEFFLQSGRTPYIDEQPMRFPKAEIDVLTPKRSSENTKRNVTDLYFRFPQVWVNASETPPSPGHSVIFYRMPTSIVFNQPRLVNIKTEPSLTPSHKHPLSGVTANSLRLQIQLLVRQDVHRRWLLLE
ncbi:MAG: hypothetical protein ACFE8F_01765 [Promethearchaeota archaeon]